VSLAKHLNEQGHTASAIEGQKSQYDVIVDGELLFSKQREGRFPEEDEINRQL
jgi:predicted Rdx family selenoprotein